VGPADPFGQPGGITILGSTAWISDWSTSQIAAVDLAAVARDAEQAGADALWACDHLFWHGPSLECLVALTVAATATERAFLALCIAAPEEGAVALAGLDIDDDFSSELLRRAARQLVPQ